LKLKFSKTGNSLRKEIVTDYIFRSLLFFIFLSAFFSYPAFSGSNKSDRYKERQSYVETEVLAKSRALKLFKADKFTLAIIEFRRLDRKYSNIVAIRKYIEACLSAIKRDPETAGRYKARQSYVETEVLAKSRALKLFKADKFTLALKEFRRLDRKYSNIVAIRRYIGACLFWLKRDQEATGVFNAILKIKPDDSLSRDYLSKIHRSHAELDKAEKISDAKKSDRYKERQLYVETEVLAKSRALKLFKARKFALALKAFKRLDRKYSNIVAIRKYIEACLLALKRDQEASGGLKKSEKISEKKGAGKQVFVRKFLKTTAAHYFKAKQYKKALKAFNKLEKKYPKNVLVKRYKGLTLARLGHPEDGMAVLKEALKIAPDNVSTHRFMAQVFIYQKKYKEAKKELEYVIRHDKRVKYQKRSKAKLVEINKILRPAKRKKFSGIISLGDIYNSNPTLKSRKRLPSKKNKAFRLSALLGLRYNLFSKGRWKVQATFTNIDALHSHGLHEINYNINIVGANINYITKIGGKKFFAQYSPSYTHTFVQSRYYSQSFSHSVLSIYPLANWWKVIFSYSTSYAEYSNDGSRPEHTARKGWTNELGLTQNFYMNKAKTLYFKLGFDYGLLLLKGTNRNKEEFGVQTALYYPLMYKMKGKTQIKFLYTDYPDYGSPPASKLWRRDQTYTFSTSVSRKLNRKFKLRFQFMAKENRSKDNIFSYLNYSGGPTLTYIF